jgi:sporulation protein YlmC with PRC-barrel domain
MKRAISLLAIVALLGGLAAAAAADTQPPAAKPATANKPGAYNKASNLIGLKVVNSRGESLGKIEDLVINTRDGHIVYAAMAYGGVVSADKFFALPWEALSMPADAKNFVLNMEKADLDRIQGFGKNHWPREATRDFLKNQPAANTQTAAGAAKEAAKEVREGIKEAKHEVQETVHGHAIWRASSLMGMTVRNETGEDLGKISDLAINLPDGKVLYAALSYGGVAGVGNKVFAVPHSALKLEAPSLKANDHVFVLNIQKPQLDQAGGFDKNRWPFEPDPLFARSAQAAPGDKANPNQR